MADQPKIGSGLHNLGNTCFFNAVTQVILHTQSLASALQAKLHSTHCKKQKWCILCSLEDLYASTKKSRVVAPNNIVGNLKTIFKKFRLGRQEDSHEFLRYLVEGMQEAETGKLGKEREKNELQIAKTLAFKVFGGRLRTFVHCLSCEYHSLTSERYYDISIECQRSNSLMQGLNNFFKVDELSGPNKYRCENCKQLSNARKGFSILTVPDIITFQLKRFTNSMRKIGKMIHYPEVIDVSKFIDKGSDHKHDNHTKLELFGIVVHAGGSSYSGHYYSYVKFNKEWYELNDSNVSKVKQSTALNQQAYLLFYKKIGDKHQFSSENYRKIDKEQYEYIKDIEQENNNNNSHSNSNSHNSRRKQSEQVGMESNGIVRSKSYEKNQKMQIGEMMTNIVRSAEKDNSSNRNKNNNNNQLKVPENGVRKNSLRKKSNEVSEQDLEETKRKLSMDIEALIKEAQDNKHKQSHHNNANKTLEIGGKRIDAPVFGMKKQEEKKFEIRVRVREEAESDDEEVPPVPTKLKRRRSKEEALSSMSIMEMLLKYSEQLMYLKSKLPRKGAGHRLMRPVYNLRRSEIAMKKRKLG